MFERQPGGAFPVTGDDQRGDLDDLPLTSDGRTSLLLCTGDVAGCGCVVAAPRSRYAKQRVLDGGVGHLTSVWRRADARLISH